MADCVRSIRSGRVYVAPDAGRTVAGLGPRMADSGIDVADAVRAGAVLCESIAEVLENTPLAPELARVALRSAQTGVADRAHVLITSYLGRLAERQQDWRLADRRHLARELHDFVGANVSLAQRHLELHRLYREREHPAAEHELAAAQEVLHEVLDGTRRLLRDLRAQPAVADLRQALEAFVAATAPSARVDVQVSGCQSYLGPAEHDEIHLICREGLRNAITHGHATQVRVRIVIGPDEVSALVDDDGIGFDPGRSRTGGHGLTGMRERAELLGGTFELASTPGRGTRTRVTIPLHGNEDRP